ncbi:MAG: NADH-quinone oxidoreductase subunit NuoG, partial [Gammaproteobacteria bacterium]
RAPKGAMLIQVTDEAGIDIPRFCYHEKLSVAANCRMCLVDVEKAPKPLPACATPVSDGMKVFTRSPRALSAQKATMEFLLINHPLDCPICDQGGECELQDLALGYGKDVGRYSEGKRVVADKNIGPLVSTDMTRCIHCTRCVRFGTEIAGIQELGATGRGENMRIGTYVERSVDHELSGNIIDLCPVGALNNKPFRMRGRGWEMTRHSMVSPHDALGTNFFGHVLRRKLMRAVPRQNEAVNETWMADRDRFSCEGLNTDDRLLKPMVKRDGQWHETDWEEALEKAGKALSGIVDRHGADELGMLAAPTATLEELFLLQKLARGLGTNNIDHRVRQADFRDDESAPLFPWLGQTPAELEDVDAALLVGSTIRKEVPLLAHRVRKAALKGGKVSFINATRDELFFEPEVYLTVHAAEMAAHLAGVLKAACAAEGKKVAAHLSAVVDEAQSSDAHESIAHSLADASQSTVLLGVQALGHPDFADLRQLAAALAEVTGSRLGYVPEAGNSAGAWLAGVVPHRQAGGKAIANAGMSAAAMLAEPRKGYLLLGLEPELDCWNARQALAAMRQAEEVVAITPYVTDTMRDYATVLLPAGTYAETFGTWVNAAGEFQTAHGAVPPVGDARPGWKILRVLGNVCGVDGFDYMVADEVLGEAREAVGDMGLDNGFRGDRKLKPGKRPEGLMRAGDKPIYAVDPMIRRSLPLQQTADGRDGRKVRLATADAEKLGLAAGDVAVLKQDGAEARLTVLVDEGLPAGQVWVPMGTAETAGFGSLFGGIEVARG